MTNPNQYPQPTPRHDTHLCVKVALQPSLRRPSAIHAYSSKFCHYTEIVWVDKTKIPADYCNVFHFTALRHNFRFWHGIEFDHEMWRIKSDILEWAFMPTEDDVIAQLHVSHAEYAQASQELETFERALGLTWEIGFVPNATKY